MAVVLQGERALPARQRSGKARGKATPARQRFTPAVMASSAAVLLASICVGYYMWSMSSETLLATRDFYGVNRVWEINADQPVILANQLTHGRTAHGFQFITSELRNLPTTYYAEKSGVGLAFANHSARPGPMRVGALGMGIGIIASYGQPGDVMRFYEINPNVIEIAEGQGGHFSFLTDSQADIQVIPGDARVSLERELAAGNPQNLDLLVLDTFLGDAMPLHLLTREAMELYLQHLRPGGVMAVNVSNRYFDLDLAVYRLADALSLPAVLVEDQGDGIQSYDSVWMLLSRDADFLASPAIVGRAAPRPAVPAGLRVWTDDYSNLFQYLK
jgi:hypothetical protein